jgi:hypothetical protein
LARALESTSDALVVTCQFDCGTGELGWFEAERSKGEYCNAVAPKFEFLEPLMVVGL